MTHLRALEGISLSWNVLTKAGIAGLLATPLLAIGLYALDLIPDRLMSLVPFAILLPFIGVMSPSLFMRLLRMANGDLAPAPFREELEHAARRVLYDVQLELERRGHRFLRLELHIRYIEPNPGMRPDGLFLLRLTPASGSDIVVSDHPGPNLILCSEVEALLCPSLRLSGFRRRALFRRFEAHPLTVDIDLHGVSNHVRLKRIAKAPRASGPIRNFCDKLEVRLS